MRIGIVGAGMAGLGAARTLKEAGLECVLFEQSSAVGGRVATQKLGEFTFDTGATSIAPRGLALEKVMLEELSTSDLALVEKPIYTHVALRVSPGDPAKNAIRRYSYRTGNAALPKMLADGHDVRLEKQVTEIERDGKQYVIDEELFDAVILTPPTPQAQTLLWSLGESRAISSSRYRSCLSVMLGYSSALEPLHYHAVLDPEQRHPLTWLSIESQKIEGRAPSDGTALVVQFSPAYSLAHFDHSDEEILEDATFYIHRLFDLAHPVVCGVKRWKYSLAESYALFETVNRPGSTLLLAGDGVLGSRVEYAYESGVRAAKMLMV